MNIFGNHVKAAKVLATNKEEIAAPPINDLRTAKRRIRMAVSIFYFFQGLCFASWASRIPQIKSTIGLSDGALGSVLFALPAGQLCTMPISGYLVGKYGSKNIIRFGLPLYAISMTNLALAHTSLQLAIALFVFGVCGNISNISVNTQGVDAERMYHRPIMASFHGAWSVAGFVGAIIGLVMTSLQVSPHYHFMFIALLVILAVLTNYKYLVQDKNIHAVKAEKKEKSPLFHVPNPVILQLGIIGFFAMSCEGAMFDWSGIYFQNIVHAPEKFTTVGYACFMIMMATGRFLGDRLVVRYGRKRLMQVCGILIMTGLLTAVVFPYFIPASIGFLLVGCGVSTNIPNVFSLAGEQKSMSPSAALASVSSISYLGFLMGPPLIGYTSQLINLRLSYCIIAVFGCCITILVSRLKIIKG